MRQDFFEELALVEWEKLGYSEIPQWIRDLTSDNRGKRVDAAFQIEKHITNAGSESHEEYGPLSDLLKTEAPIKLVPFLIELLEDNSINDKYLIVEILRDMAVNIHSHLHPEIYARFNLELPSIKDIAEPYKSRAYSLFAAIHGGKSIYQSLIEDEDTRVIHEAKELLRIFTKPLAE